MVGVEGSGEVEDRKSFLEKNLIIISNPLYANLTWRLQRTYVEEGACRRDGQEARRVSIIRGTI